MSTEKVVKIITYNILCSKLSDNKVFPEATSEQLDPEKRLIKIKAFFNEWISDKAIICLQELGRLWYCDLLKFFLEQDYILVYTGYGTNFNDYMGVAIAHPKEMKINKIDIVSTANFVKPIKTLAPPKNFSFLLNVLLGNFIEIVYYMLNKKRAIIKQQLSTLELISNNNNILLMIEFENFTVATYHMPLWLDYRKSATITIAEKILQTIKKFSSKPFFLTGDFNTLPDEPTIQVFKENNLNTRFDLITCFPKISSTFDGKNINTFKGQIDYIFYEIESNMFCKEMYTYSKNKELINTPNELDPSDHLPVVGIFSFIK